MPQLARSARPLLALAMSAVAIAGFAACGGDDDDDDTNGVATPPAVTAAASAAATADGDGEPGDDEAAVQAVLEDAYAAFNAGDVDALLALFTLKGAQETLGEEGATLEEIRTGLTEFIGQDQISTEGFENVEVDGDEASLESREVFGIVRSDTKYRFVREDGTWLIDGQESLETEIPDGATAINVDMDEFSFGVNAAQIADAAGAFALEANNVGEQPHEMGLARIPADADIETLLMTEEDVPGFEFLGGIGPFESGESGNLVLTETLETGRYILVCFLPDTSAGPEGQPHAFLGMYKEFTIE